jgi:hypothetical protein
VNNTPPGFLDSCLSLPGVVACGIRQPDRSVTCRRNGGTLSAAQVEQLINALAVAVDMLGHHHLESNTLTWTFDHARIHLARRFDGAMLALFTEYYPGQPAIDPVGLLHEFHQFI